MYKLTQYTMVRYSCMYDLRDEKSVKKQKFESVQVRVPVPGPRLKTKDDKDQQSNFLSALASEMRLPYKTLQICNRNQLMQI